MKCKLFFLVIVSFICACTTQADKTKIDNTKLYYSYKICEQSGKCEHLNPSKKKGIICLKG